MCINLWKHFRGHPEMLIFCNFLKILMVSGKTIHRAFRINKQIQSEIFFLTIYQNYTLALNCV